MIDEAERKKRMVLVNRIAIGMAEMNHDPILTRTNILTESTFQGNPRSEEELDSQKPVARTTGGGRYFTYVRMDGRGQIDIIWPSGIEKTIKFWIPEEYLSPERSQLPQSSRVQEVPLTNVVPTGYGTEVEQALQRMKKVDPRVPFSISEIPGFPFSNFTKMQEAIQDRRFAIAKFSFQQDPTILKLVAPTSRYIYLASTAATFTIPLVSVVLALTVSAWFFLGLLYFLIGSRLTINIWKNTILEAAHNSEASFCLLFYSSKINAYDLTSSTEYEWQKLTGKS